MKYATKKGLIVSAIALGSLFIGSGVFAAYNALNYHVDPPVWQFFPNPQNPATSFSRTDEVQVYKFTDNNVTCYESVSPSYVEDDVNHTFNTSISCVK